MMTTSPRSGPLSAAVPPIEEIAKSAPAGGLVLSAPLAARAAAAIVSDMDRDALFAEFAPLVRRLIRQYAGEDPEMREDMRGEIYYRFCLLLDEFDPARGVPLRPYLVRKLSAAAYTFARHHWRRDRRELSMEFGEEMGDQGPSIDPTASWDHALAMEKVLNVLPEGITQLPRRQRQVVVWRYYEQRSFEEISERLEIRVATARSILRHGLNNLRRWIQREKLDWEA
jgi:RNA polymerase sigma factor (sigma-70 family)